MERINDTDIILIEGLKLAKLKSRGQTAYGWNQKSAGCEVENVLGEIFWFKVQFRNQKDGLDKLWFGEIEASNFQHIQKPKILSTVQWETGTLICRGDLYNFIPFKVCSQTPHLKEKIVLNDDWLNSLSNSLHNLNSVQTDRISVRQDLINRRIKERFGDYIDTTITNWVTIHGDLHWANVTEKECWIFDWESWGKGPAGLDAAFLYCFSLLQPIVAEKIYATFNEELNSPDGLISQLFTCSELLRMFELYQNYEELVEPLKFHASNLIAKSFMPL